jgi:dynein heavy chain
MEKYTAKTHGIFSDEIDNVKRTFNAFRRDPPRNSNWPRYSGAALWARSLKHQIEHSKSLLDAAASYLTYGETEQKVRIRMLLLTISWT